jgi:hypothetical protein
MSRLRITFVFWLALLAGAAQAEISVDFDKERIEAGKPFVMSLVVPLRELPETRGGAPELAELGEFTLTKFDSIDDVQTDFFMRGLKVRKYSFHLVAPRQEGRYALKPMWDINGARRNLGSVTVQVQRPYDAAAMTAALTPSKKSVYEGEQLSLTLTLLTYPGWQGKATPLTSDLGSDFAAHRSDMKDFSFGRSQKPGVEMEAKGYYAWISPLRTGNLNIPAMKFGYTKVGAPKVVEKKTGNFSFRSVTQEPEEATTASAPLNITVQPLPTAGRPAEFNGMVGQYKFNGTLDKEKLQVGEAATLTLTISGNGKPGVIPDPPMPSFAEFRTVPPETKLDKAVNNGQIVTSKVLRIFLYPKKAGSFTIAPIRFAWFDPAKKSYQTAETPAWTLQVEKGELTELAAAGGSDGLVNQQTIEGKEIEQLGTDIRHIHSTADFAGNSALHRSAFFWALFVLPWLLLAGFIFWQRDRLRKLGNAALQRRAHARKALHDRMTEARTALAASDAKKFYAALGNGLEGYMADVYNKEFRGMTRAELAETLRAQQLAEPAIATIQKTLADCDYARFAPVTADRAAMEAQLRATEALCATLEVRS